MPGIMDILGTTLGGDVTEKLGRQIGADPQATGNAIQAALPMLLAGLSQNAAQPGGANSLLDALQRDHDGSVLDDLGGLLGGALGGKTADGAGILGHVLGPRQAPAQAAVSRASGLDGAQVAQLLALLAPIVMGALGRVQRTNQLDAGGLGGLLQNERANVAQAQPDLMSMATQLLDRNKDGSALDDVLGGLGGLFGKR